MKPLVSAIILNYRTPQHAVRCVEALLLQTIREELEILVVDNHSEDDSIGVLRNRLSHFPEVRILESPINAGFGIGYNTGLRHARGAYILINNPTKKLATNGLAVMVEAMEQDPTLGIVGPKLIQDDGSVRDSARAFPRILDVIIKRTWLENVFQGRMRRYRQLDAHPDTARDTDWVIGGCLLVRKTLLQEIDGFDPRFFLFFEDIDLCRRAWQAGFRVRFLPTATASDKKQRLSEGGILSLLLRKTGRSHIKSALQYFWKWRNAA